MRQSINICNKCGCTIEGKENHNQNERKGKLLKKMIPILPWRVRLTTQYWKGYEFDLCNDCKKELFDSLKHKPETYDC